MREEITSFEAYPLEPNEAVAVIRAGRTARDRAILTLLWRTGLRSNEVCSLQMDHVRFRPDSTVEVKVNRPKNLHRGAPKRVVACGKKASDMLKAWLAQRGDEPGPFFTTSAGQGLITSQIRRTVSLAGKRAGLNRRVHPHAFRHTFAKDLYLAGVGVLEIQEALGHRSVDTTLRYLKDIGATRVVEILATRDEW